MSNAELNTPNQSKSAEFNTPNQSKSKDTTPLWAIILSGVALAGTGMYLDQSGIGMRNQANDPLPGIDQDLVVSCATDDFPGETHREDLVAPSMLCFEDMVGREPTPEELTVIIDLADIALNPQVKQQS